MFLAGELAQRCNYRHLPVTPTVRSPLGMTGETWATVKGVETARFASGDLSLTHFLTFLSKYSKQCHFSGPEAGFFLFYQITMASTKGEELTCFVVDLGPSLCLSEKIIVVP